MITLLPQPVKHSPELGQLDTDAHQAPVGSKQAVASILSRSRSLRVVTVRHGDRRAAVAIGARSVTLWVGCGSHEGFERKSPL